MDELITLVAQAFIILRCIGTAAVMVVKMIKRLIVNTIFVVVAAWHVSGQTPKTVDDQPPPPPPCTVEMRNLIKRVEDIENPVLLQLKKKILKIRKRKILCIQNV
ncbi:uncharacterized protein LOC107885246 [Acyrthosiphon pisum]|uniref:Uncharacterized protein n=1 Tax=Acyrthosiphon pisum TaxID=7029 RepID=A0A8R2D7Q0_ACYPI|nr:uncharacterized protein LOC107885246 [Acyrthosiphon pisum]|eukprot:XP_016664312.1 PREDICTED: uncharacterized protein LOC107885246 [Acyrthosiphon pisum]